MGGGGKIASAYSTVTVPLGKFLRARIRKF
jgi:hypothetical protein